MRGLAPRMQRTPRRRQHSRACIANTSTALSGLWGGAVRQGDGHNEALPLAPVARSAAEARPRGSPFPVRSREAPRSRAACHRGPPHGTDGPQHTHAGLSRVTAPAAAGWASPAGRASSAAWPQPGVVVEFEQRSMETDRRLSAAADRRPAVTSRISRNRVRRRRFHTCTLNRTRASRRRGAMLVFLDFRRKHSQQPRKDDICAHSRYMYHRSLALHLSCIELFTCVKNLPRRRSDSWRRCFSLRSLAPWARTLHAPHLGHRVEHERMHRAWLCSTHRPTTVALARRR